MSTKLTAAILWVVSENANNRTPVVNTSPDATTLSLVGGFSTSKGDELSVPFTVIGVKNTVEQDIIEAYDAADDGASPLLEMLAGDKP